MGRRSGEERKLPGKISIGRLTGGSDGGCITIRVTDESSRMEIAEITMTPADFGDAVTGLGECPAQIVWRGVDRIGYQHEHKQELVTFDGERDRGAAALALAKHERDGWRGTVDDLFNHHKRVPMPRGAVPTYRVGFHRWVKP